ncbi:MAG: hypothetical protein LBQ60_15235 [Bacteroidales bacterium]|jgi:hypothetical protein|nr:hypothetical protein [Bacteroidales bacterium]
MKKLYLFLGLVLVYSLMALSMNHKVSKEKLKGRWRVEVAEAPEGYRDYIVDIKDVEGIYKIDILFVEANKKVADQALSIKENKILSTKINVSGEEVEVSLWSEKENVKGIADTSMGKLPIEFTRIQDNE